MISFGVPAGTTTPCQLSPAMSGVAGFRRRRHVRQRLRARLAGHRQPAQPALDDLLRGRRRRGEADRRMARDRCAHRQARAVEWDMHEVETERQAERFADEMSRRARPRRRVAVLAWIGLDESDELTDGLRRHRRVHRDHQGRGHHQGDGVEVLFEFIGDFVVERRVDDVAGIDDQQSVAVGRRLCRAAHADIAAPTAHVLDEELLADMLRQSLRNQAGDHVSRATSRVRHDHAHGAIGVGLRPRQARRSRKCGRSKLKESTATKLHGVAPLVVFRRTAAARP